MLKYRCMDFKHLRWVDKVSIPWFFVLDKQNNKFSDSDDHIMFTIYLENDIFGFGLFTSSICLTFDNWPTWKKSDHHNIYTQSLFSPHWIYIRIIRTAKNSVKIYCYEISLLHKQLSHSQFIATAKKPDFHNSV